MSNRKNRRAATFLTEKEAVLDSPLHALEYRTTFSFRYFDGSQEHGPGFSGITPEQLQKLCVKLVHYSKESIEHWKNMTVGKGRNHIFERYGEFPSHSFFTKPPSIPNDVEWGRFRLESDFRLAGFHVGKNQAKEYALSENTFYIVFLDPHHKFYPTK